MTGITVTALNVYPVKSMKGIPLERVRLTALGLEHDRRWMVVRDNGRFLTQRDNGRLALIRPALENGHVTLSIADHGSIALPAEPAGRRMRSAVWKDDCEVVSAGEEISDWLTERLQSKDRLHLVAMAPGFTRPQRHPERMGANTTTVFADASPFLVASEDSLDALNHELAERSLQQVPMSRFRPNIVVRGLKPFTEHAVAGLSGSAYALAFRDRCERCVVTTIDQETGVRDAAKEPFRTLADINPMPDNSRAPAFGENATLESGDGAMISIGDQLSSTSATRNHRAGP